MSLTEEQITEVKQQLLTQLDNFPEEKRNQIKNQIESMSNQDVENFVKQNQLTHLPGGCIFCAIIDEKIPSHKIEENEENIAILEINPLSKGHTIILPKKHDKEVSQSTKELAEKIKEKIEKLYSPKEIQINEKIITDHAFLELIPLYGDETERKKASEEELRLIQKELSKETEKSPLEEKPSEEELPEKLPKLKRRIP